ncbi:hypothetical protein BDM02DRAFT_3109794 [Thelephora ganbajun]|uniref:Uncharacterized protein n=1 Tax=Thelephora ganbajun TaxID=370292 RepID=A0ACB6ZQA8_THEGA|nr:hypothetical protein BDM02DRAFT_3109794 [Thelephora ganbajun]
MSLITRIALLVLAVPFVLAHGDDCGKDRFKWDAKDICLHRGGPRHTSTPPTDTDCPFNWSWHTGKGCCAPHQPPDSLPPPQCPKGWDWIPSSFHCTPHPTTPTHAKPPTPSRTPGKHDHDGDKDGKDGDDKDKDGDKGKDGDKDKDKDDKDKDGKDGNGHTKRVDIKKRQHRSRHVALCPKGLSACPVSSLIGGDYECVDTLVDLDNCGGCATLGEGQNCNAIPGIWNVGCEQSACKVYTCAEGYAPSRDGRSCNPL